MSNEIEVEIINNEIEIELNSLVNITGASLSGGVDNRVVRWEGTDSVQSSDWSINDVGLLSSNNGVVRIDSGSNDGLIMSQNGTYLIDPSFNNKISHYKLNYLVLSDGTNSLEANQNSLKLLNGLAEFGSVKVGGVLLDALFSDINHDHDSDYAPISHNHNDIYFTETEINTLLNNYSLSNHDHDSVYYTETETDTLLSGYALLSHNHNSDYYTQSQIDATLSGYALLSHNHDLVYAKINGDLLEDFDAKSLDTAGNIAVNSNNAQIQLNDTNSTDRLAQVQLTTAGGSWYVRSGGTGTDPDFRILSGVNEVLKLDRDSGNKAHFLGKILQEGVLLDNTYAKINGDVLENFSSLSSDFEGNKIRTQTNASLSLPLDNDATKDRFSILLAREDGSYINGISTYGQTGAGTSSLLYNARIDHVWMNNTTETMRLKESGDFEILGDITQNGATLDNTYATIGGAVTQSFRASSIESIGAITQSGDILDDCYKKLDSFSASTFTCKTADTFSQGAVTKIEWKIPTGKLYNTQSTDITPHASTFTRIEINTDGKYKVSGDVRFTEATGQRAQAVTEIYKNGTATGLKNSSSYVRNSATSSDFWNNQISPIYLDLVDGDYIEIGIEIEAQQTSTLTPSLIIDQSILLIEMAEGVSAAPAETVYKGGIESFSIALSNNKFSPSLSNSQGLYMSILYTPTQDTLINEMSFYVAQTGTNFSTRLGIFSRGTNDSLLVETVNKSDNFSLGWNTIALESEYTLLKGVDYMLTMQSSCNGSQIAYRTGGLNENAPNHMGRYDAQNAGAPTNGMVSSASYTTTAKKLLITASYT